MLLNPEDEEYAKKNGTSTAGSTAMTGTPTKPTTFSQMQQAGYARPAPPQSAPTPSMNPAGPAAPISSAPAPGPMAMPNATPTPTPTPAKTPATPPTPTPTPAPAAAPSSPATPAPQTQPPAQTQPAGNATGTGAGTQLPDLGGAASGSSQTLPQYANQSLVEQMLAQLLNKPSGYDDPTIQSEIQQQTQSIDDQYALQKQYLNEELAGRGLGTVGDSSIGLGRLSDLNVGQKSAREQVTTNILNQAAQQRSQDLQNALGLATNYGMGMTGLQLGQQNANFQNSMQLAQLLALMGWPNKNGVSGTTTGTGSTGNPYANSPGIGGSPPTGGSTQGGDTGGTSNQPPLSYNTNPLQQYTGISMDTNYGNPLQKYTGPQLNMQNLWSSLLGAT